MIFAIVVAVLMIAADQVVKYWTVQTFAAPVGSHVATSDVSKAFLPGIMDLTRVHNDGAGWSSFSGMRWALVAVSSLMILILAYLLIKKIVRHPIGVWACCLIISGGVGNLIDRIRLGYVIDMFATTFISFPVFNVADCCVTIGAILGAIYYLWFMKYDEKKEQKP